MRIPASNEDRFFVNLDKGYIEWLYYNPDSESGGQYVLNHFTLKHIMDAMLQYPKGSVEMIFEHVGSNCKQYLADVGTPFYRQCANRFEHEAIAKGISVETFQLINELFLAADLINEYCVEEFGSKADFSDLEKIGLAYTTTEDDCHEIQSYANLKECRLETYLDDQLIVTQDFKSLEEMNAKALSGLSFVELIEIPDMIFEEWEQNAREEDLACRLTVFISEVDPYMFMDQLENGEGISEAVAKTRAQLKNPVCIIETICELQVMVYECGLENAELNRCYELMYDLHHLYNDNFNLPVYDRETVILDDIFEAVGVKYTIGFDEIGLKIADGEHTWHDEEFYKWFSENVLTAEKCHELEQTHFIEFADYKELSEHNGVRIGTKNKTEREEAR